MTLPATTTPRPRWLVPLLVAVALALVTAAGVTTWALTRSSTSSTPAAAAPPRSASIECVTISRAYEAWDSSILVPRDIDEVVTMDAVQLDMATEKSSTFAAATAGWPDQPAKQLAVAAATVPVELGFGRLMAIGDGMDEEQAGKIADAINDARVAYQAWRIATCI